MTFFKKFDTIKMVIKMLKFNFDKDVDIESNLSRKDYIINKFNTCEMIGWNNPIEDEIVEDILKTSKKIKKNSECLVVLGIGGSYLGSKSLNELFKSYYTSNYEIVYLGNTLSTDYINETLDYLKDKDFTLNVISKSGSTLEIKLLFDIMIKYMKNKYKKEELKDRIIITTSPNSKLHEMAKENSYKTFFIPNNIGGRFSLITPAHLLPLSLNIDIKELIRGYNDGKKYKNQAYKYACIRNKLFLENKYIENFCFYNDKFIYFGEFLKQLFAETEGKDSTGVFPIYSIYTRDLHSIGQFIQEGNKIIFETTIQVDYKTKYKYKDSTINEINDKINQSVIKAHKNGNVYQNVIILSKLNEYNIGELVYFFMLSVSYSALTFGVNPFNQDGVEEYKKISKEKLEKII